MAGSTGRSQVASQLWFTAPLQVEVREVVLPAPAPGQVLVRTRCSAVSAGTELLVYRGQLPQSMALDSSVEALQGAADYPLQYGYACVGEVIQVGDGVDPAWTGRQVFSFQPHASHFLARPDQLLVVPADIDADDAVFLPNMETAVNLLQDGQPLIGERVVVLGQGIVGLLVSALLTRFPLAALAAVEGKPVRQEAARALGVPTVYSPGEAAAAVAAGADSSVALANADLIFEVSGAPDALNLAIQLSGYTSRIVIGSWYGSKRATIDLGGEAHRNRLQLITSQVSTLAPQLSGRWDKQRRFALAWDMIRQLHPRRFITESVPLQQAGQLYRQLHEEQSGIVQAVFHYPG